MAKRMPVGTIREWLSGFFIKAHEPFHPYSQGWIPLKTSDKFDEIGRECDRYAVSILGHKLPINGEKVLDHELDEFSDVEGNDFYKADNFKQYEGWEKAGRYSFRNQFSKLFMKNDMALSEQIYAALVQANEAKGGDGKTDLLTPEEKKQIRAEIRRDFKDDPMVITEEKANNLLGIVIRTKIQVEEGLDFKDPEKKKAYDEFQNIADSLPLNYEQIRIKRDQKTQGLEIIEANFADNWGVRESGKDYINKKFDEYVKKYADQISKDNLDEQMQMFGVTMDMAPDEFYAKIYEKAKNPDYSFLEKYVGKEIAIVTNWNETFRVKISKKDVKAVLDDEENRKDVLHYAGKDGTEFELISNLKAGRIKLSPEYSEAGNGFKDLIYLRFMKKYGKSMEGDWTLEQLPAVHNVENIINELPSGHFATNDQLNLITNKDYKGGDQGGYAWYNSKEKRINLSAACIEKSTVWGVLSNPTEFKSVMLHEIGHAVDQKLGKDDYYNRKKFVVDAGWTYASKEIRAGMSATGDQKDIPRTGSNSSTKLITAYAHKSPSEAFAEYYSFYNLNKSRFDKFFETGDRSQLAQHSKKIADSVSSEQPIKRMMSHRTSMDIIGTASWNHFNSAEMDVSDRGRDRSITLNSPWVMNLSKEERVKLESAVIKQRKDLSIHSMPPVVAVRDGLKRHVIDGGVRMEVAKMNKQLVPTIEISNELYRALKSRKMTDHEIADVVYTKHRDDHVPKQIAPEKTISGLIYRDNLIPMEAILENHEAFRTMKQICESKELEKALQGMFEK